MTNYTFHHMQQFLIEDFIKKIQKKLNPKKISVKPLTFQPKNNSHVYKDNRINFSLEDEIQCEVTKKNTNIGKIYFSKWVCRKIIGRNIISININYNGQDNFENHGNLIFHPHLGIRLHDPYSLNEQIDYSGFKFKSDKRMGSHQNHFKKSQFEDYKNEIGRGHEDLALYFKLSLKNIVKQIK